MQLLAFCKESQSHQFRWILLFEKCRNYLPGFWIWTVPSPDANFFLLGGTSMLASQVASKIRKRFSIAFSGSEVFQHPSANELGGQVDLPPR